MITGYYLMVGVHLEQHRAADVIVTSLTDSVEDSASKSYHRL